MGNGKWETTEMGDEKWASKLHALFASGSSNTFWNGLPQDIVERK